MIRNSIILTSCLLVALFFASCTKETSFPIRNDDVLFTEASTPVVNLSSGLVAYYPFNGNANDASLNKYHGTVVGATLTKDKAGKTGKAYSFNSVLGNYISLPLLTPLNGATKATVAFQVKTNKLNNGGAIFGHWSNNNGGVGVNCGLSVGTYNGNIIDIGNYSGTPGINTPAITAATWHNIIIVVDYTQSLITNKVKVYDNGKQLTLLFNYFNNSIGIATSSFIGRRNIDFGSFGDYFDGTLDEIRIYNRVLSSAEITSLSKL